MVYVSTSLPATTRKSFRVFPFRQDYKSGIPDFFLLPTLILGNSSYRQVVSRAERTNKGNSTEMPPWSAVFIHSHLYIFAAFRFEINLKA